MLALAAAVLGLTAQAAPVNAQLDPPNSGARDFYARLHYEEREVDFFKPIA